MGADALVDRLIASGRVPDPLVRAGVHAACATRLRRERRRGSEAKEAFVELLRSSPIAEQVEKPNEQHYEVPPEFFRLVLGPAPQVQLLPLARRCAHARRGRGGDARADVRAGGRSRTA